MTYKINFDRLNKDDYSVLSEIFLGAGAGVEDAVRGTVGLVDTVLFDSLPDLPEQRLFERRDSLIGSFVEGTTQFLAGFIPIAGALGKVGGILNNPIAKGITAGAITDFTVFDAQEERLSNLIQSIPQLSNPVTEFLAADEGDSEITGRIKNVLEGAGLGVLTEGVIGGIRALKKVRRGARPEEILPDIEKAIESVPANPRTDGIKIVDNTRLSAEVEPEDVLKNITTSIVEEDLQNSVVEPLLKADAEILRVSAAEAIANSVIEKDLVSALPQNVRFVDTLKDTTVIKDLTLEIDKAVKTADDLDLFERELFAGPRGQRKIDRITAAVSSKAGVKLPEPFDVDNTVRNVLEYYKIFEAPLNKDGTLNQSVKGYIIDRFGELPEDISKGIAEELKNDRTAKLSYTLEKLMGRKGFDNDPIINLQVYESLTDGFDIALNDFKNLFIKTQERGGRILSNDEFAQSKTLNALYEVELTRLERRVGKDSSVFIALHNDPRLPDHLHKTFLTARAYNTLLDISENQLRERLGRALTGGSDKDLLSAVRGSEFVSDIVDGIKGTRITEDVATVRPDALAFLDTINTKKLIKERGGRSAILDNLNKVKTILDSGQPVDSLGNAVNFIKATRGLKISAAETLYQSSLLMSVKTPIINLTSSGSASVFLALERMLGGAISGNPAEIRRGWNQFIGMIKSVSEAASASKRSFVENRPVLLEDATVFRESIESRSTFKTLAEEAEEKDTVLSSALSKIYRGIDKYTQLPFRTLLSGDEFIKQATFRGKLYSDLYEEGVSKGLSGDALSDYIASETTKRLINDSVVTRSIVAQKLFEDSLKDPSIRTLSDRLRFVRQNIDREAKIVDDKLVNSAIEQTKLSTFTSEGGRLVQAVENLKNTVPGAKFVIPFVTTPMNILKFPFTRMNRETLAKLNGVSFSELKSAAGGLGNIPLLNRTVLADLNSEIPSVRADARGRLATAVAFVGGALSLALSGRMSGSGPESKAQRSALLEAGWQPFSVRVGDKWVSYSRAEPFSITLGLISDFADYIRFNADEDAPAAQELLWATILSVAHNMVNKSFTQGVTNLLDALNNPNKLGTFAGSVAGGFIPTISAQIASAQDPFVRDLSGFMNKLRSRVPYLNQRNEVLRDIFGEPIEKADTLGEDIFGGWVELFSPIKVNSVKDKRLEKEIAILGRPFSPPSPIRNGIDLRDIDLGGRSAYDRYNELVGIVEIGGKRIKNRFREIVSSPFYKSLSAEIPPGETESPRSKLLKNILSDYRREAFKKLQEEVPELKNVRQKKSSIDVFKKSLSLSDLFR